MFTRLFIVCCCALGLTYAVHAQKVLPALQPDGSLLGLADTVLVGTITAITPQPDTASEDVTVKETRLLKGAPNETLIFQHRVLPPGAGGGGMQVTLAVGQSWLLFLQKTQQGWSPVAGQGGIRPAEQADQYAKLAAATVTVTFAQPPGPYYFGQWSPIVIRVQNQGKVPIYFQRITVEGFFISPRLGGAMVFRPYTWKHAPAYYGPVPPDATITNGMEDGPPPLNSADTAVAVDRPDNWALIPIDTYFATSVAVRVVVQVTTVDPAAPTTAAPDWTTSFSVATRLTPAICGYPPAYPKMTTQSPAL